MLTENQQLLIKKLDSAVKTAQYGNVTVNVMVKDQEPILKSLNIVIMKRRKYKLDKC